MNSFKGFVYGIITSVTFGLIPLFTLPLMREGLPLDSILFYRFLFATIALAIMMRLHKESFFIQSRDLPMFILLAVFYTASALFLFWGYEFMGAGMATTLHFTYPVFVTLLMLVIFGEKASWVTWLAIALAIFGVAKLSLKEDGLAFDPLGMVIVLLSAVGYASYITTVNKSRLKTMNSRKLAFYVFVFTTLILAGKAFLNQGIQPIPISVNQSRMLFFTLDYLDRLTELLKKYQLVASECIFIDDSRANVQTAFQLGMNSIQMKDSVDTLVRSLATCNVTLR